MPGVNLSPERRSADSHCHIFCYYTYIPTFRETLTFPLGLLLDIEFDIGLKFCLCWHPPLSVIFSIAWRWLAWRSPLVLWGYFNTIAHSTSHLSRMSSTQTEGTAPVGGIVCICADLWSSHGWSSDIYIITLFIICIQTTWLRHCEERQRQIFFTHCTLEFWIFHRFLKCGTKCLMTEIHCKCKSYKTNFYYYFFLDKNCIWCNSVHGKFGSVKWTLYIWHYRVFNQCWS